MAKVKSKKSLVSADVTAKFLFKHLTEATRAVSDRLWRESDSNVLLTSSSVVLLQVSNGLQSDISAFFSKVKY